jgi:hypothetical protein
VTSPRGEAPTGLLGLRLTGHRRWVVRTVMVAVGVLGLTVFAAVEKTHPRPLPTVLLVCAVVAVFGLLNDVGGAEPTDWAPMGEYAVSATGQDPGLAANVRLLENHLTSRDTDPLLAGRLARMTSDRLSRLGLHRGDPAVERQLGPTLTAVLDGPPHALGRADIEECIRRIEELTP